MKKTVIFVAGGKGERMRSAVPKQFIEIQGMPVLMRAIKVFHRYDARINMIVVLPASQIGYWETLCAKHNFNIPHLVASGGETRFHSVKNGLRLVELPSLIAVHDGVRPLVDVETISRCFECAKEKLTAVPVIELTDSVRWVEGEENRACDRSKYRLVQTPQVFDGALLKEAYEQEFSPPFTDDASVVEACGGKIWLVEGNRENIKITTTFDLALAEFLFSH